MLILVKTQRFSVLEVAVGDIPRSGEELACFGALGADGRGQGDTGDDDTLGFFGDDAPLGDTAMQVRRNDRNTQAGCCLTLPGGGYNANLIAHDLLDSFYLSAKDTP